MANTFRPSKSVSVRQIPADETDRKKLNKDFRERKANQDKIKKDRFAKIEERRKSAREGGKGINIEITSDS